MTNIKQNLPIHINYNDSSNIEDKFEFLKDLRSKENIQSNQRKLKSFLHQSIYLSDIYHCIDNYLSSKLFF